MKIKEDLQIGLTIGGGAARGAAIFGIIEGLENLGIKFKCISGSSVGAIVGAYYALYGEVETLKNRVLTLDHSDWKKFADFNVIPKKSLIKANFYKKFLKSMFGNKTFSDTKIPLIVSATNLSSGEIEYFSSGKIFDAVLASSAYPGIFPAVKIRGKKYVDSGVLNNLPYEILLEKYNLSKVVVINLAQRNQRRKLNSAIDILLASVDLMFDNFLKSFEKNTKEFFIFHPKFEKQYSKRWNFKDLDKKYKAGIKEFNSNLNLFLKWIRK